MQCLHAVSACSVCSVAAHIVCPVGTCGCGGGRRVLITPVPSVAVFATPSSIPPLPAAAVNAASTAPTPGAEAATLDGTGEARAPDVLPPFPPPLRPPLPPLPTAAAPGLGPGLERIARLILAKSAAARDPVTRCCLYLLCLVCAHTWVEHSQTVRRSQLSSVHTI